MSLANLFAGGGYMMWPLLFIGIGVLVATALATIKARSGPIQDVDRGLTSILFWGTMAPVLGLLGTVIGVMMMGVSIQRVGEVGSATVWGGFTVALITLAFGLVIFVMALLCWFAVRAVSMRARTAVS